MKGYVSLHREIMEHWIWEDPVKLKRWLTILMNVNHAPKKFPVGNELFTCNPGQSFRSIQQWTDLFICSKPTTIKFFKMLENDGMILTEILGNGNRRKHLLTVVNWEKYQQKETENFTRKKPKTLPERNPNVPYNNNEEIKKKNEYAESSLFYEIELKKSNGNSDYKEFVHILFGSGRYLNDPFDSLLKMEQQITWEQFQMLQANEKFREGYLPSLIYEFNEEEHYKGEISLYLSLNNWLNKS